MASGSVRYIVTDVDAAVEFYTRHLAFELVSRPAPSFAIVAGAGLQIMLSEPRGPGGGGQPMADGRAPEPGGWNRIQIEVDDLRARADELRTAGVPFRTDAIIEGRGANQILIDDPSGNPVELFERLGSRRRSNHPAGQLSPSRGPSPKTEPGSSAPAEAPSPKTEPAAQAGAGRRQSSAIHWSLRRTLRQPCGRTEP